MNMQDNELDELFRAKLGGLEMQPSAHIWDNINAELGGEKKRAWTPRLSVAAALLVMLSVGAWFMVNKPVKEEQAQVAGGVKKSDAAQQLQSQKQMEAPAKEPEVKAEAIVNEPVNHIAIAKQRPDAQYKEATVNHPAESVKEAVTAPENNQLAQVLAAVPTATVINPVVPEVALTNRTIDTLPSALKTTSTVNPLAIMAQQPVQKKKRGIHSLGGLINAVVSAVDKREDKFIEFTETDEDNANITGINLGLIKVKKEK